MKAPLLYILILVTCYLSKGQEFQSLLNEQFDDNKLKWYEKDTPNLKWKVANGKYVLQKETDGWANSYLQIPMDPNLNFEISTGFSFTGEGGKIFDLKFGMGDKGRYSFVVNTEDRAFKFYQMTGETHIGIIDWTPSEVIQTELHASNEISVRRVKNQLHFYLLLLRFTRLCHFINFLVKNNPQWLTQTSIITHVSAVQGLTPCLCGRYFNTP